jgi:hypothetical protein
MHATGWFYPIGVDIGERFLVVERCKQGFFNDTERKWHRGTRCYVGLMSTLLFKLFTCFFLTNPKILIKINFNKNNILIFFVGFFLLNDEWLYRKVCLAQLFY